MLIKRLGTRPGLLLLILSVLLVPACSTQAPPAPTPAPAAPPPAPAPAPAPVPEPADPAGDWEAAEEAPRVLSAAEINQMGVLQKIYFDYDKAEVRTDQRATLQSNATWLRENTNVKIVIEGHADDRGTREYNLALGDRRSNATKDYLISLGINQSRIEMISYGEERPAETGEHEQAWARNRRAEFVVVAVQ